jgi:hypothetical protein
MKPRMWFVRYSFEADDGRTESVGNSFWDDAETPFLVWITKELQSKKAVIIHEVVEYDN